MHSEEPLYTNEELNYIARRLKADDKNSQPSVQLEELPTGCDDYNLLANKAGLLLLASEFIDKAAEADSRSVHREVLASRIDTAAVYVTVDDGKLPEFTYPKFTLKDQIVEWLVIEGFLFLVVSLFAGIVEMAELVYRFIRALLALL